VRLLLTKVYEIEQSLENIKKAREEKGMTQRALAEKIGISESFYCQIEGGKRRLTIDYAMKIANAVSKSLDEIFLNINLAKCHDENKSKPA